jgi:hypothetical protein
LNLPASAPRCVRPPSAPFPLLFFFQFLPRISACFPPSSLRSHWAARVSAATGQSRQPDHPSFLFGCRPPPHPLRDPAPLPNPRHLRLLTINKAAPCSARWRSTSGTTGSLSDAAGTGSDGEDEQRLRYPMPYLPFSTATVLSSVSASSLQRNAASRVDCHHPVMPPHWSVYQPCPVA